EVGVDAGVVAERDVVGGDVLDDAAKVEPHAVGLVGAADEGAEIVAEHAAERYVLGRDDVDFEAAVAQRGGDLETDEAGAGDRGTARALGGRDYGAAVGERAQVEDARAAIG